MKNRKRVRHIACFLEVMPYTSLWMGDIWGEVLYALDSSTAKTVAIATKVAVEII